MFGFVIAGLCFAGLFVTRRSHFRGFRGRSHFALRYFFRKLNATAGQEKVIRDSFNEVRDTMSTLRPTWLQARQDIARAITQEQVDPAAIQSAVSKQDELIQQGREAVVSALKKVHAVLDVEQRKALADLIEKGPRRHFARC